MKKQVSVEYEYWTRDKDGRGYCSAYSLEDALEGHFQDMKAAKPLGPIVGIKVVKRITTTKVKEEVKEF